MAEGGTLHLLGGSPAARGDQVGIAFKVVFPIEVENPRVFGTFPASWPRLQSPDVVREHYGDLNISYLSISLTRNIKVSEICCTGAS
jgi:hypothetical protein